MCTSLPKGHSGTPGIMGNHWVLVLSLLALPMPKTFLKLSSTYGTVDSLSSPLSPPCASNIHLSLHSIPSSFTWAMGSVRDTKPLYLQFPLPGTLPPAPTLPYFISQQYAASSKDPSQTRAGRELPDQSPSPYVYFTFTVSSAQSRVRHRAGAQ